MSCYVTFDQRRCVHGNASFHHIHELRLVLHALKKTKQIPVRNFILGRSSRITWLLGHGEGRVDLIIVIIGNILRGGIWVSLGGS